MNKLIVKNNTLFFNNKNFKCAFGKNGFTNKKVEGDNKTPIGKFILRRPFCRFDKINWNNFKEKPIQILESMGWCDDNKSSMYNKLVKLPFNKSHEKMYRDDNIYDIIYPISYNDTNPIQNKGSAIFFHIARDGYKGTEGCIAVNLKNMLYLSKYIDEMTEFIIEKP